MDTENVVVENDVLEAINETIDEEKEKSAAKACLANVSYGFAKGTGKLIGGGCKAARRLSKIVKQGGKKIAGVRHKAVAEDDYLDDDLYAQLEELADEVAEDRDVVELKPSTALDPGTEEATSGKRATRALIAALESDLAAARSELEAMRSQAEGTEETSALTSQLKALQDEKKALLAELEQARSQTDEMAAHKDVLSERTTALESELAAAKVQLDQAHSRTRQGQSELKSQLNAIREKNESLITDLEKTRSKIDQAKSHREETAEAVEADPDSIIPEAEQDEAVEALADDEIIETETAPPAVTIEEVAAAVFDSATEKIIFIKALSDMGSEDEMVRIDAAKAIGGIRHELSARVFVAHVAGELSPQVRSECIKALAALNMKEGLPVVERALTDPAGLVRLAAVWSLYRLAGPECGPALTNMFADEDEEVRRRAVTCIGWLGREELAVSLVPMLDDNNASMRQAAVEAMGNLRSRVVVSSLIEHLSDPEKNIRKAIIAALKTITGKKMNSPFPKNQEAVQQLIARWRQWWI
jgi:HEAT repeat protein